MSNEFIVHTNCTYCNNPLEELLYLGALPAVNVMRNIADGPYEYSSFPLTLAFCKLCQLVQLKEELYSQDVFPDHYPYLSGTTQILRENFEFQYIEINDLVNLKPSDLLVDIGSNDGTLLSNYVNTCRVLGVEPTSAGSEAERNGIPTWKEFFNKDTSERILRELGQAKIVTACNVFAHIPNLKDLMANIDSILEPSGIFVSESHYLFSLLNTLQFDTVYHEHLRYYSVAFLRKLFSDYGFEIIRVQTIPTHGGSIRVWASRKGAHPQDPSVHTFLENEQKLSDNNFKALTDFSKEVLNWRQDFRKFIATVISDGSSIGAIGSPSRASTLLSFSGLTHHDIVAVGEISTSHKIGRYMPGTRIPVIDERVLIDSQPSYLLILSWHIASELIPKLKEFGFRGKFIIPLPELKIIH